MSCGEVVPEMASHQLVTSWKILVTNAIFLVAWATRKAQFLDPENMHLVESNA